MSLAKQTNLLRAIPFRNTLGGGGRVGTPTISDPPPQILFHVNPPPPPMIFFSCKPPNPPPPPMIFITFSKPHTQCVFFKYNPIPNVFFSFIPPPPPPPPIQSFFSLPHPLCFSQCSTPPSKTRKMQLQDVGGSRVALSDVLLLKHGNL